MKIQTVAIFGAGAVGSYFLWGLSEKLGDNLWVIAHGDRKKRYERDGFVINGKNFYPEIREPEKASHVDLLLIASKYDALKSSLEEIGQIVTDHTIVLSLLNGVDSEEILESAIGKGHILYSMMQIASRRKENSISFYPEKTPGLFYGEIDGGMESEAVLAVDELLKDTPINYHIRENILQDIWLKMALNVSMNLPQAIVGCQIGAFAVSEYMNNLRWCLRNEVCEIAAAKGINISELSEIEKMKYPSVPTSKYSTLQDLEAGRHTEIEMFAGTLIRLGETYGIATPYCKFAYNVIKALEEKNDNKFCFSDSMK